MEEIQLPASASCGTELTRSNSYSDTSSLTSEIYQDILQPKANKRPCECAALTNEKHDQYLNRLEASFVEQFHQSMGRLAWCSKQIKNARTSTVKKSANTSSEQLTVLRNGRWQKVNYGKTTALGSDYVVRGPRIEHFQLTGMPCLKRSSELHGCCKIHRDNDLLKEQPRSCSGVRRSSEDLPVNYAYYCDSVGNDEEGSGQNFMDEVLEDELKLRRKKLKTTVVDTLDDDQIVPRAKSNLVADLVEESAMNQSPSEDYRSFACPQSNVRSFVGGTYASSSSDGPIT